MKLMIFTRLIKLPIKTSTYAPLHNYSTQKVIESMASPYAHMFIDLSSDGIDTCIHTSVLHKSNFKKTGMCWQKVHTWCTLPPTVLKVAVH